MSRFIMKPAVMLGRAEHTDFTRLAAYLGDGEMVGSIEPVTVDGSVDLRTYYRGEDINLHNTIPSTIIQPFLSLAGAWLAPDTKIDLTYQRSVVYPGQQQGGFVWHFDGSIATDSVRIVVASDILTTMTLSGEANVPEESAEPRFSDLQIARGLSKGRFVIPEDIPIRSILGLTGTTLHKGKVNNLSVPVVRTFLRLSTDPYAANCI